MIDPVLVDSIAKLGALGFTIIAIAAFVFRWVYTRGEVNDREKVWQERYQEVRTDRDEWRTLAQSFGVKVERLTDIVELLTGKKVD